MSNNTMLVRNFYKACLMGFESGSIATTETDTAEQAGQRAAKGESHEIIAGYIKSIPQVSVSNEFGDLAGEFLTPSNPVAMVSNALGFTPAFSMPRKLAYKGVTVSDISIEFELFYDTDAYKDIFLPIIQVLSYALPLRYGYEAGNDSGKPPTSLQNVLEQISQEYLSAMRVSGAETSAASNAGDTWGAVGGVGKTVAQGGVVVFSAVGQAIINLASKIDVIKAMLEDTYLLQLPAQMKYDIFFYAGYNGAIKNAPEGYSRAATFITGPWLISSVSIQLGDIVIHPGFPDRATVTVGLTPTRTGDGSFVRDIFNIKESDYKPRAHTDNFQAAE